MTRYRQIVPACYLNKEPLIAGLDTGHSSTTFRVISTTLNVYLSRGIGTGIVDKKPFPVRSLSSQEVGVGERPRWYRDRLDNVVQYVIRCVYMTWYNLL